MQTNKQANGGFQKGLRIDSFVYFLNTYLTWTNALENTSARSERRSARYEEESVLVARKDIERGSADRYLKHARIIEIWEKMPVNEKRKKKKCYAARI